MKMFEIQFLYDFQDNATGNVTSLKGVDLQNILLLMNN